MGILKQFGAVISNIRQPKFTSLFQDRTLNGLITQRAVFHDPSDVVTGRYYGGAPDSLFNGANVELSNNLTLLRAYGTSAWTGATYPTAPDRAFSFQLQNGSIQVLIDTATAVYLDNQDGTKTTIFTKAAGAGQGYFVAVGNVVYYGDGVDQFKYTPNNPNGISWNWGIATPTSPPKVTVTASGAAAVAWQAATVFSTMGLIVDPNGNAQQLYSANNNGDNTTEFGVSSDGAPNFNTATGGTTTDGTITWTCQGPMSLWVANTLYQPGQPIYDPRTKAIFILADTSAKTSGTTYPPFVNSGSLPLIGHTSDGAAHWQCLGTPHPYVTFGTAGDNTFVACSQWVKNKIFRFYGTRTDSGPLSFYEAAVCFPLAPFVSNVGGANVLCNGTPTFVIGATSGSGGNAGTSGNVVYTPWTGVGSQSVGDITYDNDLQWVCMGSAARANNTAYTQWDIGAPTFSVIKDSNNNLQVCMQTGTSGVAPPTWQTGYGAQTTDGTVVWVCVGRSMSWTASQNWYLPVDGFFPPSISEPYGGAQVAESGYIQAVVESGVSGAVPPSWHNTVGLYTNDNSTGTPPSSNGLCWLTVALRSPFSLSWVQGYSYAYSYKCRTSTDFYATNVPPGLRVVNGPYKGGGTGAISTASPATILSGGNTGAVNTIAGVGSTDPQVDTIVIWRSADGGSASQMFELTELPAPPPKGKVAQPWTFKDYLPDDATSQFPGLNNLVAAPINDSNDPPPVGFLPMAWHFQRIWGGVNTHVDFSGGPDVVTGNPQEAFNPVDEFPFLSTVTDCIHTPAGLIVILQTDLEAIYGGPATTSFFSTTLCPGKGCLSYNAIDVIGGEIYMMTSDGQLIMLTPSLQVSRIGFAIGDKLAAFNPANAYVTVHDNGVDNAIFVGDGATGWYRLNPHQVPQGNAVWSPFRTITGGCKMLQSVTTAPGVQRLLIGGTGTNQHILKRDLTVYDDSGVAYDSWGDIGAITLCDPGQIADLKFIEMDFAGVGTVPNVYVALDDPTPSPSWTQLTNTTYDAPQLYGDTVTPPYYPVRYYLPPNLAKCRRIRIKFDFGTASNANELYSFAIFGRLEQES